MSYTDKLGNNIRCIRIAYGETQEQLGYIIGVEKTTISQYENGKREPSRDILSAIAEHYVISIEELTQCDFSDVEKISFNQNALWEKIDVILPIVASEKALSNTHFRKAYQFHHKFFDGLKKLSMEDSDAIGICLEEYLTAFEEDSTIIEAAANVWGIMILTLCILKMTPQIMKKKPAPLMQVMARDKKIERIIEDSDSSFEKEASEMLKDFNDPEFVDELNEIKIVLKKSHAYSDIADYYLALEYWWNIVDNNLGREFNARIGIEMMSTFMSVGNAYAAYYFIFQQQSMGMKT